MSPKLSIIIPTLNEEKGIVKTLRQINKLNIDKEVLVVDGLSTDDTVKNAKRYGAKVVIEKRKGKGIAMSTGVKNAKGDMICFLDGDGTYPPKYIPKMIELIDDCDVVVASRMLMKENSTDSLSNLFLYKITPFLFKRYYKKFKTSEPTTGMRIMRKRTWCDLNLKSVDFMIELEMEIEMAKRGMKVIEISIPCIKRVGGKSKFIGDWKILWRMRSFIKKNESYLKNLNIVTMK